MPQNLRRGSTGFDVQEVQGALDIYADGIFGPVTEAAVLKFQKSRGLKVDGIVGPNTWNEIMALAQATQRRFAAMRSTGEIRHHVWLVPQSKTMACWYASAIMVRYWKRNLQQMCQAGEPDPSQVPEHIRIFRGNNGLPIPRTKQFARELGLQWAPRHFQSLGPLFIQDLLKQYGPLWTGGREHVVVITGISRDGSTLYVNDPWPPHRGRKKIETLLWLNEFLMPNDDAPFLFCP